MRRLAMLILIAAVLAGTAWAQERTLIEGSVVSGGFGGPVVKFSQINGKFAVFAGGRGGWIINHSFIIGGGGYGLVNEIESGRPDTLITFGYGGGELEWVMRSDYLLHATLQGFAGAGGYSLVRSHQGTSNSDLNDGVFVAELNANLEVNLTTWFRVGVGAGYRLVTGVEIAGLKDSDFSGGQGLVTLKFGRF